MESSDTSPEQTAKAKKRLPFKRTASRPDSEPQTVEDDGDDGLNMFKRSGKLFDRVIAEQEARVRRKQIRLEKRNSDSFSKENVDEVVEKPDKSEAKRRKVSGDLGSDDDLIITGSGPAR
jgi:hypothetical protein